MDALAGSQPSFGQAGHATSSTTSNAAGLDGARCQVSGRESQSSAVSRTAGRPFASAWSRTIGGAARFVDRIGTCVLIGHSQGGGLSARVADARPDKVVASVVLEPAGLPATPPRRPQAIVLGDNRDKHPVTHQLSGVWDRYRDVALEAGDCLTWLDLPTMGHTGNSHLFMCDLNSDQIAALVGDWLRTVL